MYNIIVFQILVKPVQKSRLEGVTKIHTNKNVRLYTRNIRGILMEELPTHIVKVGKVDMTCLTYS